MKKLSDLIKENRNKLGISQRELAKIINVNDSYIAKIESDITKKPSVSVLIDLSTELKIDIFELLEKAGYSQNEIDKIFNITSSSNQYLYLSVSGNIDRKILNDCVFYYDYYESLQQENNQLQEENKILKENSENNDKVVDKVNWENMILKKENKKLQEENFKLKNYLNNSLSFIIDYFGCDEND